MSLFFDADDTSDGADEYGEWEAAGFEADFEADRERRDSSRSPSWRMVVPLLDVDPSQTFG